METRHADGRVEGKYGYVDIDTGEVRVIEYGADMMGFQPEGDLPDGIVVPPPVVGNATFDYDYDTGDYVDLDQREDPRSQGVPTDSVRVQNRARGNSAAPIPGAPSQNRGQNVRRPPAPTRPREESRDTVLPTPVPSRTRFQAQPARPSQPQRARPQLAPQPAAPARQEETNVNQFTAFQTNFDAPPSLSSQGLKPFVPKQAQPAQLQPARPAAPQRRPASQPVRRPLNAAPTRQQQFSREEEQEFQEINEIRGAVRSQSQPTRTSQRGGARRVVASAPLNAVPSSSSSRTPGGRSRGRARGSTRTRPSAAVSQVAPQQPQRVNRPQPSAEPATEDPLSVLRGLQASSGRAPAQNVQQSSAPRARPQQATPSRRPPPSSSSSSGSKFASFPARDTGAPSTPRRPQPVSQSQPRQPARAQPTRAQPTRSQPSRAQPTRAFTAVPSQAVQPEQPRTQQRQPVRIKSRPVIPPQQLPPQQARRPTQQQQPAPVRSLPQQTQTRFLPTPSQSVQPTPAIPQRGFQNQPNVDFDALISEFTGRQTPRTQTPQQQFFRPQQSFRPTPASIATGGRGQSAGAPQFIPRPAAAVPPAQQTPPSPNFVSGLSGSSFSLSIGGQ